MDLPVNCTMTYILFLQLWFLYGTTEISLIDPYNTDVMRWGSVKWCISIMRQIDIHKSKVYYKSMHTDVEKMVLMEAPLHI